MYKKITDEEAQRFVDECNMSLWSDWHKLRLYCYFRKSVIYDWFWLRTPTNPRLYQFYFERDDWDSTYRSKNIHKLFATTTQDDVIAFMIWYDAYQKVEWLSKRKTKSE